MPGYAHPKPLRYIQKHRPHSIRTASVVELICNAYSRLLAKKAERYKARRERADLGEEGPKASAPIERRAAGFFRRTYGTITSLFNKGKRATVDPKSVKVSA